MPVSILYLITELDVGGAEKTLYELVRRLDRRRYLPTVVSLDGFGPVGEWLRGEGVEVEWVGMPRRGAGPRAVLQAIGRVRDIVRRRVPAILHTFLFHANLVGRLAVMTLPRRERPAVISSVRVAERRYRWHLLADYLTWRLVDCEVCVSEGVRRFTRRQARIPADRLRVVPNGVDVSMLRAVRPIERSTLGCSPGSTLICFVGRLDRQKGLEYLLRALSRLRGELATRWEMVLVGEGPVRGHLEGLARRMGIGRRVRFLGWRSDALAVIAACDLFVMPSLWEGMPNAVLEAMGLGRCVVATAVEGTSELIQPGRSGLLVPPGRVRPLSEALAVCLSNPQWRAVLGCAARRRVERHFSIEAMVAGHEAVYREVLARRKATVRRRSPVR